MQLPAQAQQLAAAASAASTVSVSTLVLVVLGFYLWHVRDKKQAKTAHLVCAIAVGVLMAPSVFGLVIQQFSTGLGMGLGSLLGTLVEPAKTP
jgi:4-amino-4-deoxy-L-arabinose transferase-like glycosyltransferase